MIGANGAGKSTFLQLLTGLGKPSRGRVAVNGQNIHDKDFSLAELRQHIGLVFQSPESQLFASSVEQDIAFGPRNLGLSENEVKKRVRDAMAALSLDYELFAKRTIFELSQGEKRKAAIAGVLALNPQMLAIDEPLAGLDAQSKRILAEKLRSWRDKSDKGLMVVSHDMDFALSIANRIILFDDGRILADVHRNAASQLFEDFSRQTAPPRAWRMAKKLREMNIFIPPHVVTTDELMISLASESERNLHRN